MRHLQPPASKPCLRAVLNKWRICIFIYVPETWCTLNARAQLACPCSASTWRSAAVVHAYSGACATCSHSCAHRASTHTHTPHPSGNPSYPPPHKGPAPRLPPCSPARERERETSVHRGTHLAQLDATLPFIYGQQCTVMQQGERQWQVGTCRQACCSGLAHRMQFKLFLGAGQCKSSLEAVPGGNPADESKAPQVC